MPWHDVFERLSNYARTHTCSPQSLPPPLILAGWVYSNDLEKLRRWEETVAWANSNGCADLIAIPEGDFYFVDEPTSYRVGPLGGPMYRPWDIDQKERPQPSLIAKHLGTLKSHWQDIVGQELARVTRPLAFTGAKFRRLLVWADNSARPPWGGWSYLSAAEADRRTFTHLRASINRAIAPHEVDHVDFTTDGHDE